MRLATLREERGFVLSMVIFAVAALSIAGTALFLVVQSESAMANSGAESSNAFHLANAGLARYMGETFGDPVPEVTYTMSGGSVTVTARRILALGDTSDVYLVRSEASIADRRVEDLVYRRAVQQFALLRRRPFTPLAGFALASTTARTRNVTINGRDRCVGGTGDVSGIVTIGAGDVRGTLSGAPAERSMSYPELMQGLGVDWATMRDHSFAFNYEVPEDAWPRFGVGALADTAVYPTIRVEGDLRAFDTNSGRGLLVVTGTVQFYDGFRWDGAVLAGSITGSDARFTINGTLVSGLNGVQDRVRVENAAINYDSCEVIKATQSVAVLSPIASTWWEDAQ